ncbi:hypothetical protein ACFVVM_03935 [Nocardia sp. NPDC058176]|uniref:hypothetical protein n=1 Tax=Nocardia sp. NPDC058176 TaxID=3346368 RepID=UPI0036DAEC48
MTITAGISAELGVVRGVLLSTEPMARPEVLRSVEQRVDDGGSIVGALDALAEAEPGIADVAVAYHVPQDRKKIVSELASGRWRTSSLVSTGSAMSALVGDAPELDEFRTVVLLNVVDRTATAVVAGADRGQILASESWTTRIGAGTADDGSTEVLDADPISETIGHLRSMLASIPTHPSVVALCGSGAAEPEIATILQDELTAPVVLLPDFADATARGAALVAADQVRNGSVAPTKEPRRPGRLPLTAAAAAALLVAIGFAATTQVRDDSSPAVNAGLPSATSPSSPSGAATAVEATTEAKVPVPSSDTASPPAPVPNSAPGLGETSDVDPAPNPAPGPGRTSVVDPAPAPPPAIAPAPVPQGSPADPDWAPATATGPSAPNPPANAGAPPANPGAPSPPAEPPPAPPTDPPTPTRVGARSERIVPRRIPTPARRRRSRRGTRMVGQPLEPEATVVARQLNHPAGDGQGWSAGLSARARAPRPGNPRRR